MRIKFRIQRVPTRHTFDGPLYPKNKKYLKKRDDDVIITYFQVFLVLGVAGSVKSMPSGYLLDAEFNSASNEYTYYIVLTDPATPKTRNTWKNVMMMLPQKQEIPEKTWWWHHHHVFSDISCFWGSSVCQNYAVWVLIITFFQVFLVFGVAGSVKSIPSGYSLDAEFNSTSNEYPLDILLTGPATPKPRNTWKNMMTMIFSGISCFGGRRSCQKYSKWVLVGSEI